MRVIGLRAEPKAFTWAVAEGTLETPILVESGYVSIPSTYSFAQGLGFLREHLLQIIDQHGVSKAGIRTPEVMPKSTEALRERLRVEGVLMVACAERQVETVSGPLATLSSRLGLNAKKALDSEEFKGVDVSSFKKEKREAVLMGASLLMREQ